MLISCLFYSGRHYSILVAWIRDSSFHESRFSNVLATTTLRHCDSILVSCLFRVACLFYFGRLDQELVLPRVEVFKRFRDVDVVDEHAAVNRAGVDGVKGVSQGVNRTSCTAPGRSFGTHAGGVVVQYL
jgi:hypothetical protein